MIYEIKQYTDDEGKAITARIPIDALDINSALIFGTYAVPHPSMGQVKIEFQFPLGMNLQQCFDDFGKEANKHYKNLIQESKEKKKLWTPGDNQGKGGLIVPK